METALGHCHSSFGTSLMKSFRRPQTEIWTESSQVDQLRHRVSSVHLKQALYCSKNYTTIIIITADSDFTTAEETGTIPAVFRPGIANDTEVELTEGCVAYLEIDDLVDPRDLERIQFLNDIGLSINTPP